MQHLQADTVNKLPVIISLQVTKGHVLYTFYSYAWMFFFSMVSDSFFHLALRWPQYGLYFHTTLEALLGIRLRTFMDLEFTLHFVKIIDQVCFSRKFGFCKGNICYAQY